MPDTYANPYSGDTPLGQALRGLSSVIMSGPSDGKRLHEAEAALKLKQARENTAALGDVFRKYGTEGFDRGTALDTAIRAGVSADNLGGYERYGAANTYGAADPRTTNAFVGAGGAYGSTATGTRESQAVDLRKTQMGIDQKTYEFDNTPQTVGTDTGPVIRRRSESYGQPAVEDLSKVKGDAARRSINAPGGLAAADETTRQFVGASSKAADTPRNYIFKGQNYITNDGLTDARTGQLLPAGGALASLQGGDEAVGLGKPVVNKLQEQNIGYQRFRGLLSYTEKLAKESNANFGIPGFVKSAMQDATAVASGIASGFGYSGVQDAVADVRARATRAGVDPGLLSGVFDPNLPALHTAADLMVYQAAEALAGQQGRSVSNRDVQVFRGIVGDPREWTGNQEKFLAKLNTVRDILDLNQGVVDQNLRGTVPAAQATPAPAALPSAGAGAPQPERWERGPDGQLRRVQ